MKNALQTGLVASATLIVGTFTTLNSMMFVGAAQALPAGRSEAIARAFDQQEVDQSKFIAIAVPLAIGHKLIILEQISNTKQCWRETGTDPVRVDPLLLNFDFTGVCERSTSNHYSIQQAGQDLALYYGLRIEERQGELVLLGRPYSGYKGQEMEIGRTSGISSELMKINLDPGWRFTKRAFNGKVLDHVYLTQESGPPLTLTSTSTPTPTLTPTPTPTLLDDTQPPEDTQPSTDDGDEQPSEGGQLPEGGQPSTGGGEPSDDSQPLADTQPEPPPADTQPSEDTLPSTSVTDKQPPEGGQPSTGVTDKQPPADTQPTSSDDNKSSDNDQPTSGNGKSSPSLVEKIIGPVQRILPFLLPLL